MMGAAIAAGSEYVGMEPLVSVGPRSGVPHGTWRRRRLQPGEPAFLELAASHDRYHAALMRSAWLGPPPDVARRMMDCCLEGLDAALVALKPGATCEDVHLACQRIVDRDGFTDAFRKRTGYSVGISFAPDWGEGNVLSLFTGVTTEIVPGMCFHLPPALRPLRRVHGRGERGGDRDRDRKPDAVDDSKGSGDRLIGRGGREVEVEGKQKASSVDAPGHAARIRASVFG